MGISGTVRSVAGVVGTTRCLHRARRLPPLRASALLLLGAMMLPLAALPFARLLPGLATEAEQLDQVAAGAAAHLARALEGGGLALPQAPRRAAPPPGTGAADPMLGTPPAGTPAADDPPGTAVAAALQGTPLPAGMRLTVLGPAGEVLARRPAAAMPDGTPVLVAEHPVTGWPYRIQAEHGLPRPEGGLLPLGAAMLAMLLLAALVHRREERARDSALEQARREAARNAILAESEAQLRLALAAAQLGCWSWDESLDRVDWDTQAGEVLGWHPQGWVRSAALRQKLEPADLPALDGAMARARRTGEPAQCVLRLGGAAGRPPRWIELRTQAAPGPTGMLWHGVVTDITARLQAEEQLRLLLREVDHRAKNTLAVVQALLRLTWREGAGEFLPRVEARIAALAQAHTLLAQARWQGASLRQLAAAELGRGRRGQPSPIPELSGPPVVISPVATQPVAMVLHELASNARASGAAMRPGGALSLSWRRDRAGALDLVWEERGGRPGPNAARPLAEGLGARILDATVRDQLGGRIERAWTPDGFRCAIHLPASCLASPATAVPVQPAAE